jgi:hypothetical protein
MPACYKRAWEGVVEDLAALIILGCRVLHERAVVRARDPLKAKIWEPPCWGYFSHETPIELPIFASTPLPVRIAALVPLTERFTPASDAAGTYLSAS